MAFGREAVVCEGGHGNGGEDGGVWWHSGVQGRGRMRGVIFSSLHNQVCLHNTHTPVRLVGALPLAAALD